jgi:hypothetical protein
LFAARRPAIGVRGRLSIIVGSVPLATDVEIGRVADAPEQSGFRIGAKFINLNPEHRTALAQFIGEYNEVSG